MSGGMGPQPGPVDDAPVGGAPAGDGTAPPRDGGTGLESVVTGARVAICAGPGGVGKTTCAAAIAVEAARRGRRACVVTIDPAKRLADALGLESLSNDARQVAPGTFAGELWALMLDTKTTFDEVVTRNAATPEQARAILDNKLYRNISGALGGTQEYMAMEKLHALYKEGSFDLIVVDTPPTRHALDFLDAPDHLLRFLDNRVFRLLMTPTRAGLRVIGMATQAFLRTISKVVGGAVVSDAVNFFTAFEGMEQGFRDRAAAVSALLRDPATNFVVVAAPRRDAVAEALYFADRLAESDGTVGALIANRMFPTFAPPGQTTPPLVQTPPEASAVSRALLANLADFDRLAKGEEAYLDQLRARLPGVPVARVPYLESDVHDLEGLMRVGSWLFGEPGTD